MARPWLATLVGLAMVLSGCLTGAGARETKVLSVPGSRIGETVELLTERRGHVVSMDDVRPLHDSVRTWRTLSRDAGTDAFLQPRSVVSIHAESEHWTKGNPATKLIPTWSRFDSETGALLETGRRYGPTTSVWNCFGLSCRSVPHDVARDVLLHYRSGSVSGWDDLAGKELVVGRTQRFEFELASTSGAMREWREYEPLRIESRDGERLMLVSYSAGRETSAPAGTVEERDAAGQEGPPPLGFLARHWLWYSERSSVPVREEHDVPQRHRGEVYWTNSTVVLASSKPGGSAWHVSGAAAAPMGRAPGVAFSPFGEFLSGFPSTFPFKPLDAWEYAKRDGTLTALRTYLDRFPGATPFDGSYHRDDEHGTHTWYFLVGEPGAQGSLEVEVRQHGDDARLREARTGRSTTAWAPSLEETKEFRFARPSDLFAKYSPEGHATYASLRFNIGHGPPNGALTAGFEYHVPTRTTEYGPAGQLGYHWWSYRSKTIDLRDGGLLSQNRSLAFGDQHWPLLTSLPECEDDGEPPTCAVASFRRG